MHVNAWAALGGIYLNESNADHARTMGVAHVQKINRDVRSTAEIEQSPKRG